MSDGWWSVVGWVLLCLVLLGTLPWLAAKAAARQREGEDLEVAVRRLGDALTEAFVPLFQALDRFLCRHRVWEPLDPQVVQEVPRVAVTWSRQRCLRCGRVRDRNELRPGERIEMRTAWPW